MSKQSADPGQKWSQLTRSDLGGFDKLAKEIILTAMELGADGRISSGGRAMIRNPKTEEIMTVARTVAIQNRGSQNTRAQFKRTFGLSLEEAKEKMRQAAKERRKTAVGEAMERAEEELKHAEEKAQDAEPQLMCPRKGCGQYFPDLRALEHHIDVAPNHEPCTEDGCRYVSKDYRGIQSHVRLAHLGEKPRLGTGKKAQVVQSSMAIEVCVICKKPKSDGLHDSDHVYVPQGTLVEPESAQTKETNKSLFVNDEFISVQLGADPAVKLEAITKILGISAESEQRIGELEDEIDDLKIVIGRLEGERDEAKARADLVEEELGKLVKNLKSLGM